MSYQLPDEVALITFEDRPGFEARVLLSVPWGYQFDFQRRMTPGELRELRDLAGGEVGPERVDRMTDLTTGVTEQQRAALSEWGDTVLVRWNLADRNGAEVPANGEGLLAQPQKFVLDLIGAWTEALRNPPFTNGGPPVNGNGHVPETRRKSTSRRR